MKPISLRPIGIGSLFCATDANFIRILPSRSKPQTGERPGITAAKVAVQASSSRARFPTGVRVRCCGDIGLKCESGVGENPEILEKQTLSLALTAAGRGFIEDALNGKNEGDLSVHSRFMRSSIFDLRSPMAV